jgi:hypothetical protein
MDQNFANQIACQLHGIHRKLRSAETPQPAIGSPLIWELQVGASHSDAECAAHDTECRSILDQVNFNRARLRPNFSLNAAGGVELYGKEQRRASFHIQAFNLTDRVNVINFASTFSGTAVAVPRSSLSSLLMLTF